jgi:uncharacterized membrane protein
VLATITAYAVGKFIHVLAVVLAFGPTYAYAFMGAVAAADNPAAVPTVHRIITAIDRYLVIPGMVVILLAGLYTLDEGQIKFSESWVSIGFAALIVVGAMQGLVFSPKNRQALALAERDVEGGGALSDEYRAVVRQISLAGQLAGVLIIAAIFFMVVKP